MQNHKEKKMGLHKLQKQNRIPDVGGGDGQSIKTAVVINAKSTLEGVPAEYDYLTSIHGKQDGGWRLESQKTIEQNGRHYDVLNIKLRNGELISYYFDITKFYGRL
jgi:hypothetical protein